MGHALQLQGREQPPARQARAQQGQWVAAQGQARGGVVEDDFFALGRLRQLQRRFVDRGMAQQRGGAVLGRGVPHLLAAVARQGGQRIGSGQDLQVVPLQPGAQGQVFGAGKAALRRLCAGLQQALRCIGMQLADQPQPQAHRRLGQGSGPHAGDGPGGLQPLR